MPWMILNIHDIWESFILQVYFKIPVGTPSCLTLWQFNGRVNSILYYLKERILTYC